MKQTNKSDRFRRYLNRALLVFLGVAFGFGQSEPVTSPPRDTEQLRAGNARNMETDRPPELFRASIRGGSNETNIPRH